MKIVYDYPPNYERIKDAFSIEGNPGVIFTYGDTLYVPGGERISIDKPLQRHEETHSRQQKKMGIDEWWDMFLSDRNFRLSQELEAYREQYRAMAGMPAHQVAGYLTHISRSLSGEMYGNLMTEQEAVQVITQGINHKTVKRPGSGLLARKRKKAQRQNRKKARR
jgi:hypothetical protein